MNISHTMARAINALGDGVLDTVIGISSDNQPACITLNELYGHILAEGSTYSRDLITNAIQALATRNTSLVLLSINDDNPSAKDVINSALKTALYRTRQHMANFDIEFTEHPIVVRLDNPILDNEDMDRLDQLISLVGTNIHVMMNSKKQMIWPDNFSLYNFDNQFKLHDQLFELDNQSIRVIPTVE